MPRFTQGTTRVMFSQLGVFRESRTISYVRQAESRPDDDRRQRDEGRLEKEDGLHHSAPEADRPQDPDLLTPLGDGPSADHSGAATPTINPRPMKPWMSRLNVMLAATASSTTFWIDSASMPRARTLIPVEQRRLQDRHLARARSSGSSAGTVPKRALEGLLRGRDSDHLERRPVLEDADDRQPHGPAGLGIAHLNRNGVEHTVLDVEAAEPKVRRHREAPVVATGRDRGVDDRQARPLRHCVPDLSRRAVAAGRRAEAERRVLEERTVETARHVAFSRPLRGQLSSLD